MFEAVFGRYLFRNLDILYSAHIAYDFWHLALGPLAPVSFDTALNMYWDANIPSKPNNSICSCCIIGKMTLLPQSIGSNNDKITESSF